jgi:cation transport ATPase
VSGIPEGSLAKLRHVLPLVIAGIALTGIAVHLVLRLLPGPPPPGIELPLLAVLVLGGVPLVIGLIAQLARRELGADLLAGISIVTATLLGEYLAGAIVVLMLAGGTALEQYALARVLGVAALAARMPSIAHPARRAASSRSRSSDRAGDALVVLPHEVCPWTASSRRATVRWTSPT